MGKQSARDKLRSYLLANVGRVVNGKTLAGVAGISEWARRVRELRDEEGMAIVSHNDRSDLKPGQYILLSADARVRSRRDITDELRHQILLRDGMTCQVCGVGAGEPYIDDADRKARLRVDHIVPVHEGGKSQPSNLRAICERCNIGRSNLYLPDKPTINLLGHIRRAPRDVQLDVLRFLRNKFSSGSADPDELKLE